MSTITCLHVSVTTVSPPAMAVLLRAPVALRRFWFAAVDDSACSNGEFAAALAPQQASLELLHLDLIRSYITCEKDNELSLLWLGATRVSRPPSGAREGTTAKTVESSDRVGSYLAVQLWGGQSCGVAPGEGGGGAGAGERGDGCLAGGEGLNGLGEAGCGWRMIARGAVGGA